MRNKNLNSKSKEILLCVEKLPFFSVENLKILDIPSYYLKILFSRLERKGDIIRLKKGFYTSSKFVEKTKMEGSFSTFLEFIASKVYFPSYLSLEYVLYEKNLLTEMPQNFTLMTKNKTFTLSNRLGTFIYHKIKDCLFLGYKIENSGDFLVYKASKAKALFDFLYLRKNLILNEEMAMEYRLNLEILNRKDDMELREYISLEGSKKVKEIYSFFFKDG